MAKNTMCSAAILAFAGFAVSTAFCIYSGGSLWLTLAITFGTISYHLIMRLIVGYLFLRFTADLSKKWYRLNPWEIRLHKLLKVKKWKDKLPTYSPETFSLKDHTLNEIAQTMCRSELVHETNIVLSFLPLSAAIFFGSFWVFFITSAAAAVFDLLFVIIQRYNRDRIMKIVSREKKLRRL